MLHFPRQTVSEPPGHSLFLLFCILAATSLRAAPPTHYIATPLRAFEFCYDMDNSGRILGSSFYYDYLDDISSFSSYFYARGSSMAVTGLGGDTLAYAFNAAGQIVGYSEVDNDSPARAFLQLGGTVTDLGTLPGATDSSAHGINDAGTIVGDSGNRAFSYDGAMHDLNDTLPAGSGWTLTSTVAINNAGQIAGTGKIGGNDHAFLLNPGGAITDLGTLGGTNSSAIAMNERGDVVGISGSKHGSRAFLYRNGKMTNLGTLGGNFSRARSVNNRGQVVGVATPRGADYGGRLGFLYDNGKMINLDTLYYSTHKRPKKTVVIGADTINDLGQIVIAITYVGYVPADEDVDEEEILLTPLPTITIAGGTSITTHRHELVIRGRADYVGEKILYRVGNKGAFRVATGTKKWHFPAKLQPGVNPIFIRARGIGGSTSTSRTVRLTVTRN
ncbi:MAG: hypothetical protein ACREKL_00240 [Chthoniobacterales bacterium]